MGVIIFLLRYQLGDKDSYELEEMLDNYLLDHFRTQVEDGSIAEACSAYALRCDCDEI